jgi:monoamine oxidase
VITGWAAGPNADALAGRSPAELQKIALDSLHKLLGEHPGSPEAVWFHDWSADPFALGAYSYVRTGGLAALAELQKPVENTLCFAGEALATGHMGTVHGAIESGIEAAAALAVR